jgi:hypothetical protein
MNLEIIAPEALHQWWLTVREGVVRCLKHDTDGPIPEDIYWLIKTSQVQMYVGKNEGHSYCGFIILNIVVNPFSGKKRLHIWYAYNAISDFEIVPECLHLIEDMAESQGIDTLSFRSDKLAFERWAGKLGFKLHEIELYKGI